VRYEDGGTSFFVQERVGKAGKPVNVVKVRSMKMDTPEVAAQSTGEPENNPHNTLLGKKIRALELDELHSFFRC